MKDAAIIVFQKKPERGKVKTRLAQVIGNEKAVEAYQHLLNHTHQQVSILNIPVFIYFENEIDPGFPLQSHYTTAVQSEGDLGHKMKTAIKDVLSYGFQKAMVIGSDCPGLTADIMEKAIDSLASHDLVIGPAKDGGYYLIGMSKVHDDLFEKKTWSTSAVLADTLADAARLGLNVYLLNELSDVDVYDDLDEGLKTKLGIN